IVVVVMLAVPAALSAAVGPLVANNRAASTFVIRLSTAATILDILGVLAYGLAISIAALTRRQPPRILVAIITVGHAQPDPLVRETATGHSHPGPPRHITSERRSIEPPPQDDGTSGEPEHLDGPAG